MDKKEHTLRTCRRLYNIFIYIVLFSIVPAVAATAPVKVAILPFKIHAEKDYTFLQKGIVQMLTSRLSDPGKVTVIDPVATDEAVASIQGASGDDLARQVGLKLNADRAIHGSLTVLGDSVSIDAKMIDVTGANPPLAFFKQTQGMDNVIGQINLMAADINQQAFGIEPPAASQAAAAAPTTRPAPVPTPAQPSRPSPPDIHMHPEKLLQQGRPLSAGAPTTGPIAGAGVKRPTSQLNPAFIPTQGIQARNRTGFWKSRNFKELINGIDVGDVDNDGMVETVVAMPEKVLVLRFHQDRQQTVAEIKTERFVRNISVSIGDINGNGIPEIFVTALTVALDGVQSSVFEFDGQAYKKIVSDSHYYYNIIDHPTIGPRLFAQFQNGRSNPQNGAIFEMEWKGAGYEQARKILPAHKANVLGMTIGNITGDQRETVAAFNTRDHLFIMNTSGKEEWKGDEAYGGTTLYFSMPPTDPAVDETVAYLPTRLRAVDLDKDGQLEILTAKNHGGTGRGMDVQRYFKKSNIVALVWDGLGLTPSWLTHEIGGRVQDFVVVDFDNDGIKELLAAAITKEGAIILTDARSALIAFELNLP